VIDNQTGLSSHFIHNQIEKKIERFSR